MSESMMCPCSSTSSTAGLLDRRAMTCLLRTDERGAPCLHCSRAGRRDCCPVPLQRGCGAEVRRTVPVCPLFCRGVRRQNRPQATYCCLLGVVLAPVCPLSRRGAVTERRG